MLSCSGAASSFGLSSSFATGSRWRGSLAWSRRSSDLLRDSRQSLPPEAIDYSQTARWQILSKLGAGSFGTVYEAKHESGLHFAAKLVEVDGDCAGEREAFDREVSVMRHLRHDNIVQIYGSCARDNSLVICMELAAGGSLRALLGSRPEGIALGTMRRYIRQILQGLDYLHCNNVVHRDIKPHNILIAVDADGEETIKLADFGTSRIVRTLPRGCSSADKGTTEYMAPELFYSAQQLESLAGGEPDVRIEAYDGAKVDIWALGCTVLRMMGRPIWEFAFDGSRGQYTAFLMFKIALHEGPPHGMPGGGECSPPLRELLELCFRREPGERPGARELLGVELLAPR